MANVSATIIGHQGTGMGQYNGTQYNIVSHGVIGTRNKIRPKKRVLTGPWPTSVCRHWEQNQAQEKSCDRAMANVSAAIIGHQGTGLGQYNSMLIRSTIGTPNR